MKVQNISGRTITVTLGRESRLLDASATATFPDSVQAELDYAAAAKMGYIRKVGSGIAGGATTDTAGYAIGATSITLASDGTGRIAAGQTARFGDDTTDYLVTTGTNDVSGGGTIVVTPALVAAIPAAATAIAVADPVSLPIGAQDQQLCILTFGTSYPADAGTLTINGVTFEFDTASSSTITAGNVRIPTNGLTAAADIAAITKTTVNANATLDALDIKITDLLTISTTTYAALVCPVETTLVVEDIGTTHFIVSTEAPIYRSSRRVQMFTHTLTGTTGQIYTGFSKIESVLVQVRSSSGTVLLYNGAVTTSNGWISLAAAPAGTITGYDPVRVLANTDVVTLLVTGW